MNLYDILKIAKTASKEQIKKAYRKLSTIHHPDKGGDPEQFKTLVCAYNILFDDDKRKRYDSGETAESITKATMSEDQESIQVALQLYVQIVMSNDPDRVDILHLVKKNIDQNISNIKNLIQKEKEVISRFERSIKRIKTEDPSNIFLIATNAEINKLEIVITGHEKSVRIGERVLKLFDAYSYDISDINHIEVIFPSHFAPGVTISVGY